jgi:hypothetical protein
MPDRSANDSRALIPAGSRALEISRAPPDSNEIELELTAAQISQVLRTMAEGKNRSRSIVLSGLADARRVIEADRGRLANSHLCRALLTGMVMLAAFPADGSYTSNAEVARALGLAPRRTSSRCRQRNGGGSRPSRVVRGSRAAAGTLLLCKALAIFRFFGCLGGEAFGVEG